MKLLLLAVAVAAFLLLGLATDRHHEKFLGRRCTAKTTRRLRMLACVLLVLSAVIAFRVWGPVFGAIGATGAIMTAAGLVFLGLNLLPGRAAPGTRQSQRR